MGLRGARGHASAAYIASSLHAECYFEDWQKEVDLTGPLNDLLTQSGKEVTKEGLVGVSQKEMSH